MNTISFSSCHSLTTLESHKLAVLGTIPQPLLPLEPWNCYTLLWSVLSTAFLAALFVYILFLIYILFPKEMFFGFPVMLLTILLYLFSLTISMGSLGSSSQLFYHLFVFYKYTGD